MQFASASGLAVASKVLMYLIKNKVYISSFYEHNKEHRSSSQCDQNRMENPYYWGSLSFFQLCYNAITTRPSAIVTMHRPLWTFLSDETQNRALSPADCWHIWLRHSGIWKESSVTIRYTVITYITFYPYNMSLDNLE